MRYAIVAEYDGAGYSGWQRQKNAPSVQAVIEDALEVLLGKKTVIIGSGRTDRGVHAIGQVAHFDTESELTPFRMTFALNAILPPDVKIRKMYAVPQTFHAQRSAKRKTYLYRAYVSRSDSPLKRGRAVKIIPPLDIAAMRIAAVPLVGEHDFRAFSSTGSPVNDYVRELYDVRIEQIGEEVDFYITGNGFLYNMVRIIVGTLVSVGKGKLPVDVTERMLATGNRRLGGKTFPAEGLYLYTVEYPRDAVTEDAIS